MATRKAPPSQSRTTVLTSEQKRSAIARLEKRVEELGALDVSLINEGDDPKITRLSAAIEQTLASIYGAESHQYVSLVHVRQLDQTTYNFYTQTSIGEIREGVKRGVEAAIATLQQAADSLKEELEHERPGSVAVQTLAAPSILSKKVFIVHGHDELAQSEAARFITKAGLTPIILHEQASGGRTVIEKLEHYSDVGFAVVLLTPDDVGGPKGGATGPRARQNVIAELFYFIGKLGRSRVCALLKGELEIPSDIGGVVYVPMDGRGAWKMDVLKELEVAGHAVDWAALR